MELIKKISVKEQDELLKALSENGELRNPEGVKIALLENIEVLDRKNRDGQEFNQIQLDFIASDGKRFKKTFSVDFARKLFTQLETNSEGLYDTIWVIKPTGLYKNVGFFAVCALNDDGTPVIVSYVDDALDFKAKLKKLGL